MCILKMKSTALGLLSLEFLDVSAKGFPMSSSQRRIIISHLKGCLIFAKLLISISVHKDKLEISWNLFGPQKNPEMLAFVQPFRSEE